MGETVRKLKTEQTKLQNIATNNINNNKMMWSENLKKEFSDSLGGVTEQLKKENPKEWVQRVNGIKVRTEEQIVKKLLPQN